MPVEVATGEGWLRRSALTLLQLLRSPNSSFRRVQEPVDHGVALAFISTIRLPAWGFLLAVLLVRAVLREAPEALTPNGLGLAIDPHFADALSLWLLLMVPLGAPLLYFIGGIMAHGVTTLTGGAEGSLGASMRAFGYTAGWPLLAVACLDVPLYLGAIRPEIYASVFGVVLCLQYGLLALALARTHDMGLLRALLVATAPTFLFAAMVALRALLELPHFPFLAPPPHPYVPFILP
ncbi:MAG: hypothetical protein V3V08_00420 [Nannocystaceae bacterium]